jgi:hypothetical protein
MSRAIALTMVWTGVMIGCRAVSDKTRTEAQATVRRGTHTGSSRECKVGLSLVRYFARLELTCGKVRGAEAGGVVRVCPRPGWVSGDLPYESPCPPSRELLGCETVCSRRLAVSETLGSISPRPPGISGCGILQSHADLSKSRMKTLDNG